MSNQTKMINKELAFEDIRDICGQDSVLIEAICKSVYSQKKVSKANNYIETVIKLFDYFSYFNSLTPDDTVVNMQSIKSLDDIIVPKEFEQFIMPSSVKVIAGNRRLPELLQSFPAKHHLVKEYSYHEYIELVDQFRSYFKKDGLADVVTLASIRKEVSLMDVLSIASVSGCVNYDSEPYYPVILTNNMELVIGTSFLQDDADIMIKDFCAKLRF